MGRLQLRLALALWLGAVSTLMMTVTVLAEPPANDAFERTWARTDLPVSTADATRTWMWGPEAFTGALTEAYAESLDGQRTVQYFDKSRMEITFPGDDQDSIWYVTNGLLVNELMTGAMQTGHNQFEQRSPAQVNVAGDPNDPNGPTYASFGSVLDEPPSEPGTIITKRIRRDGTVGDRLNVAIYEVTTAITDEETNHTIATPFWEFMNSSGTVWEGFLTTAPLFENPYFATGRPVTEAYWASVQVSGTIQDVLLQCFERRCLTFTPSNAPEWQVEAGNVGQHYHAWRYGDLPVPADPGEISFTDGLWIVGTDIQPGIYRNSPNSMFCSWARLSDLTNTSEDVIAFELATVRTIVEIAPTDLAFESDRCGTWSNDTTPITSSPTADFDDGTYFVTSEVAPGVWRSSGGDSSCYWQRLSGFGGTLDEIIANDASTVDPEVVIEAGDVGFSTSGCGTWTYAGM